VTEHGKYDDKTHNVHHMTMHLCQLVRNVFCFIDDLNLRAQVNVCKIESIHNIKYGVLDILNMGFPLRFRQQ
jgi:hypothetical protein